MFNVGLTKRYTIFTLIVVCIVFACALFLHTQPGDITGHKVVERNLDWVPFQNSPDTIKGFLLSLQNVDEGKAVYIASDKDLRVEDYIAASGWEVALHSQEGIWNPRVCSRVPSVIDSNGDMFMLETHKNESGSFSSRFIWFQRKTESTVEADIRPLRYLRNSLFLSINDNPSFFGVRDGFLYLYTFHPETKIFTELALKQAKEEENYIIKRDEAWEPIVEVYNEKLLHTTRFSYHKNTLIPFDGEFSDGDVAYIADTHRLFDLGNGVSSLYLLTSPYETEVLNEGEPVLTFNRTSKVYTYIVGSYSLPLLRTL